MSVTLLHYGSTTHSSMLRWAYCVSHASATELNVVILSRTIEQPGAVKNFDLLHPNSTEAPEDEESKQILQNLLEIYQSGCEQWSLGGEGNPPVQIQIQRIPATSNPREIIDHANEMDSDLILVEKINSKQAEENSVAKELLHIAPQAVFVIYPQTLEEVKPLKILVPVSGGPHAQYALQIAGKLARFSKGQVTPLFVEQNAGDDAEEVGHVILKKLIKKAGVVEDEHVSPQVCLANDVSECIREVSQEGFDLVLIGSSNAGSLRRLLFKTLPDQFLQGEQATTVAVCRRPKSLTQRFQDFVERTLSVTVPQLEREDRIALFERLESGSRWNFDFMALLLLSTAIATIGLIQNSTAVVIGAMLVAPLMTPLLGAGLALVQGNLPLLRRAAFSVGMGFVLATIVGVVFGLLAAPKELTSELAARGGPTLLDMGVGFLSGLAAAHCVARPNLSAAIAGVAIAAALVPPLSTIGVSLAIGFTDNAEGAALLFGTNVVAIVLGAATSIYAAGIRARKERNINIIWAKRVVYGLFMTAFALAIPLSSVHIFKATSAPFIEGVAKQQLSTELRALVKSELSGKEIAIKFSNSDQEAHLRIDYQAANYPNKKQVAILEKFLKDKDSRIKSISLNPQIVIERH